jgi:hypothetical protein
MFITIVIIITIIDDKNTFLSHNLPQKILLDLKTNRFSLLSDSEKIFVYRARLSALRPTKSLEEQVFAFTTPNDKGGRIIRLRTEFSFFAFYDLHAGLRRRYSNQPPHGRIHA